MLYFNSNLVATLCRPNQRLWRFFCDPGGVAFRLKMATAPGSVASAPRSCYSVALKIQAPGSNQDKHWVKL